MSPEIATLVWLLLIVSVIITGLATVASIATGLETEDFTLFGWGMAGLFVVTTIGWGIWVVYPMTAIAM